MGHIVLLTHTLITTAVLKAKSVSKFTFVVTTKKYNREFVVSEFSGAVSWLQYIEDNLKVCAVWQRTSLLA